MVKFFQSRQPVKTSDAAESVEIVLGHGWISSRGDGGLETELSYRTKNGWILFQFPLGGALLLKKVMVLDAGFEPATPTMSM